MNDNKDYRWLAGFLDGEGCFLVVHKSAGYWSANLRLQVGQKRRAVLDDLAAQFGGRVYDHHPGGMWHVTGENLYHLLEGVIPFLRVKQKEAEIMYMLMSLKNRKKPQPLHVRSATKRWIKVAKALKHVA